MPLSTPQCNSVDKPMVSASFSISCDCEYVAVTKDVRMAAFPVPSSNKVN